MNKLTIKNACELAGVSRPTLYKYVNSGKLSIIKDGNSSYIDITELIRVFPNISIQDNSKDSVNSLHELTSEISHKDEVIKLLKQQLEDKQKDNDFLKEQLTIASKNFTHLNKLLEDKTEKNKPERKKILGIF